MKSKMKRMLMPLCVGALLYAGPATAADGSRWMAGDFHQHTTYTDGSYTFDFMMSKNNQYGLDWWANSEHGGSYITDGGGLTGSTAYWDTAYPAGTILGDVKSSGGHRAMWRWQSLRDFVPSDILRARTNYPSKDIVSGYEWNVPGHEHCSVGVIPLPADNTNEAISAFEYQFDKSDTDTSRTGESTPFGSLVKHNASNSHANAMEAATWMQQQYDNKKIDNAWIIFAHVERAGAWKPNPAGQSITGTGGYNVESFRDFNNAAPDICFGFEGVPGHQAATARGEMSPSAVGGATYGGAGIYTARTGGLWDALLGEGRRWFNFANSDSHAHWTQGGSDYFPGEMQKNWTYMVDKNGDGEISFSEIADGLRSGNSFLTAGDLIDALTFTAQSTGDKVAMGGKLKAQQGKNIVLKIRFKSPAVNNNGDTPVVDHIDLIAGDITGKIAPTDPNYTNATNPSARVIQRFTSADWEQDEDGLISITYPIKFQAISKATDTAKWKGVYFRLRGTNNSITSVEIDQTNPNGDPAKDPNTTTTKDQNANAWKDLWFYGNPIFVYAQ